MLCPPRTRKRRLPRRWGGWARALRSSLSRPRCKTPFSTTFRLRHRNGNRIFSSGHDLPWITPRNTHTRPRGHTQSERVQVGMQLERRIAKCNSEKIAKYFQSRPSPRHDSHANTKRSCWLLQWTRFCSYQSLSTTINTATALRDLCVYVGDLIPRHQNNLRFWQLDDVNKGIFRLNVSGLESESNNIWLADIPSWLLAANWNYHLLCLHFICFL